MYNNVISVVRHNGWLTIPFPLGRGVQQGCPLSYHLFNIVRQVLIYYLWDQGLFVWWTKPGEPCSLYADDTAIFILDVDQLGIILDWIHSVGLFTRLTLNLDKTIAFCHSQKMRTLVHGIQINSAPVKYLGSFLGIGDLSTINFEIPLCMARIKLNHWSKRKLSLFARITVAKTFIFSLFTHILNTSWITNAQLHLIQTILNEFL